MPNPKPIQVSAWFDQPAGKPAASALTSTGVARPHVAIHASEDGITVTVDSGSGKPQTFDYEATLTGRELVDILRACHIDTDYQFGEIEPDQGEDLSGGE